MEVAFFNAKPYEQEVFLAGNRADGPGGIVHELHFFEARLRARTAQLAEGCRAVCAFVNDEVDAAALEVLAGCGVELVALRCAGFNQVDLEAAARLGIAVVRVPAYSPHAVAEHAVAMMLTLNRKIHRAYLRVREGNFALNGLMGFDCRGKTAGIVGTGKIGRTAARILGGFGMEVLAHDPFPNGELAESGVRYVGLDELFAAAEMISLHCPLTPANHHLIDAAAFERMRDGVMLINTSRGGLIDTAAAIGALKSGRIGALGLDVYEEEEELFFVDHSEEVIGDDLFMRLLTFPNVLITAHQAFLTREALGAIAATTLGNISAFERGEALENEVKAGG